MCYLLKEAKQVSKFMKEVDPIGSYHHRILIDFYAKEFKKKRIGKEEFSNDLFAYKKQYLMN